MRDPLVLRFGDLTIDLDNYRVLLRDFPLVLPYREYALLVYLASRVGQVVSKRRLMEEGLGRHDPGGMRMLDEHIRHLKGQLERGGGTFIHTMEETGYCFRPEMPRVKSRRLRLTEAVSATERTGA